MRKHLLQDFTEIYHLDLHGNVRKNPKLSGTTHNVFGIQVGVGVTIAIQCSKDMERKLYYYRVPELWHKTEKLAFLAEKKSIQNIDWQELQPDARHTWLTKGLHVEYATFLPIGTKEAKAGQGQFAQTIFKTFSLGVVTSRDEWIYDFDRSHLIGKTKHFIRNYNSEVFRWSQDQSVSSSIDSFVNNTSSFLKWTDRLKEALQKKQLLKFEEIKVRKALYRPFCKRYLYFDHLLNQRRYQQHIIFPTSATEGENVLLIVSDHAHRSPFSTFVSNMVADLHLLASTDGFQCFPFYTYAKDGSNRRENITDWSLAQFQA
ncbi:MAG: type ISP restriction/modification enzyme, partial [Ktedonobacteraceae bacterium]